MYEWGCTHAEMVPRQYFGYQKLIREEGIDAEGGLCEDIRVNILEFYNGDEGS
jgi:hypothetical protein